MIKFEDYQRLIQHMATRFAKKFRGKIKIDQEDIYQELYLVFERCRQRYDETKARFSTYFCRSCYGELTRIMHTSTLIRIPEEKPITYKTEEYINQIVIEDKDNPYDLIDGLLKDLSNKEKKILWGFIDGKTTKLANEFRVSNKRIYQIKEKAIEKIRQSKEFQCLTR